MLRIGSSEVNKQTNFKLRWGIQKKINAGNVDFVEN